MKHNIMQGNNIIDNQLIMVTFSPSFFIHAKQCATSLIFLLYGFNHSTPLKSNSLWHWI